MAWTLSLPPIPRKLRGPPLDGVITRRFIWAIICFCQPTFGVKGAEPIDKLSVAASDPVLDRVVHVGVLAGHCGDPTTFDDLIDNSVLIGGAQVSEVEGPAHEVPQADEIEEPTAHACGRGAELRHPGQQRLCVTPLSSMT